MDRRISPLSGSSLRMLAGMLILATAGLAAARDNCFGGAPHVIDDEKRAWGARHHPIGRPLPDDSAFNRPDRCRDGVWFFDRNGNARPDAEEARLFGPLREVDCGSCHGESEEMKSPQSASVFLRMDASRLCLQCHRL